MNYQTQRIITSVQNNYNFLMTLNLQGCNEFAEPGSPDPADPKSFEEQLDSLFNNGASIAFEILNGWDDEGGQSYNAYIIKPEFFSHYQYFLDSNMDKQLYNFSVMTYISQNPNHFAHVWAGPF